MAGSFRFRVMAGGSALLGTAMAGAVLIDGLADNLVARGNPMLATRLNPRASRVLAAAAEARETTGDTASAKDLAARALARSPIDVVALRTLAQVRARGGDQASADALMDFGGTLTWRDTPTQLWLLKQAALVGDYPTLLQRADALARRDKVIEPVLKVLTAAAAIPEARSELVARLVDQPPWRRAFFARLEPSSTAAIAGIEGLLAALRHAGAPANADELAPYLNKLFEAGQAPMAAKLWHAAYPAARLSTPFDGGFEQADEIGLAGAMVAPFQWQLGGDGQALIHTAAAPTGRYGQALLIESAAPTAMTLARQGLTLVPGRYVFSARVLVEDGAITPRLALRLMCHLGGTPLASLVPPLSARPGRWIALRADLAVPGNCAGQLLTIELGTADARSDGQTWIDDVKIVAVKP